MSGEPPLFLAKSIREHALATRLCLLQAVLSTTQMWLGYTAMYLGSAWDPSGHPLPSPADRLGSSNRVIYETGVGPWGGGGGGADVQWYVYTTR